MLSVLRTVIHRDLLLALRRRADVATVLLFFVIVVSLFPLGIGPEPNLLRAIAPGVIWVAALLSCMLALARLFAADFADGTLEQMLVSPTPLGLIVAGKVAAHWLTSGLPLVLIAPVLAMQFDLNQSLLGVLALSLLIGTPVLSLIGAIGAALTLGLRGGGVSARAAGAAALRAGADHRRGRARRGGRRAERPAPFPAARGAARARGGVHAVGHRGIAAYIRGMREPVLGMD